MHQALRIRLQRIGGGPNLTGSDLPTGDQRRKTQRNGGGQSTPELGHCIAPGKVDGSVTGGNTLGYDGATPCFTAHKYQLSTTVPVSRMPMPPQSGHNTANHHAQRWIDSIVALNPMVQRQN